MREQIAQQPNLTPQSCKSLQHAQDLRWSIGRLRLALQQMGAYKESSRPKEQETPKAQRRRLASRAIQHTDPQRLVFLDGTGSNTKMTWNYGEARRGERVREARPTNSHWHIVTILAALTARSPQLPRLSSRRRCVYWPVWSRSRVH